MKHVSVIKILLGLILIFSGITKIVDPSGSVELIIDLGLLPLNLAMHFMSLFPVVELSVGLMLVFNIYSRLSTSAALLLYFGFLFISIYGTIIGLNSDCGCFGSVVKSRIGWEMIVRNLVFVVGCGYVWVKLNIICIGRERINKILE